MHNNSKVKKETMKLFKPAPEKTFTTNEIVVGPIGRPYRIVTLGRQEVTIKDHFTGDTQTIPTNTFHTWFA